MSGFKDDVVSILRDNGMLHGEALGWVVKINAKTPENYAVFKYLQDRKFPVADAETKPVVLFDYIIIDKYNLRILTLMKAFSLLANMGLLIIESTDLPGTIQNSYRSVFGNFTATRVQYDGRQYLVIHSGVDYGN